MLTIQGDFKKGKEMMKSMRKDVMKDIRKIERKKNTNHKDEKEMARLQHELKFYTVSVTLPAEIYGLVVNGKLLLAFIKKLKGFHYEISEQEQSILLQYGKKPGEWTGRLVLCDISFYYQGFPDVPEIQEVAE